MQSPPPGAIPPVTFRTEDKLRIEKFEAAWQQGTAPRIEDYLMPVTPSGLAGSSRPELLRELVKIDLEFRWRQPSQRGPRIEEYSRRFPELLQSRTGSIELIAEEYRARHRWGDRPGHAEYLTRFLDAGPMLRELLPQLDAEL